MGEKNKSHVSFSEEPEISHEIEVKQVAKVNKKLEIEHIEV